MRIRWQEIEEGIKILFYHEERGMGLILVNELWHGQNNTEEVLNAIEDTMFNVNPCSSRDDAVEVVMQIEHELINAREGVFYLDDARTERDVRENDLTQEERRRLDEMYDELTRPTPVRPRVAEQLAEATDVTEQRQHYERMTEAIGAVPRRTATFRPHEPAQEAVQPPVGDWRPNREPLPVEMVLVKSLMTLLYKRLLLSTNQYEAAINTLKPGNSVEELVFVIDAINKGEIE